MSNHRKILIEFLSKHWNMRLLGKNICYFFASYPDTNTTPFKADCTKHRMKVFIGVICIYLYLRVLLSTICCF